MNAADEALAREGVFPDRRMTARRKLALLEVMDKFPGETVRLIERFGLSVDELVGWRRALGRAGRKFGADVDSLKLTKLPPPHLR